MIFSRAWLHDTVSCAAWNDARKGVYLKPFLRPLAATVTEAETYQLIILDYRDISLMESVPLLWHLPPVLNKRGAAFLPYSSPTTLPFVRLCLLSSMENWVPGIQEPGFRLVCFQIWAAKKMFMDQILDLWASCSNLMPKAADLHSVAKCLVGIICCSTMHR